MSTGLQAVSNNVQNADPVIHLYFGDEQHDIRIRDLDIGDLSSHQEIKNAVATHLNVPVEKLRSYGVNWETSGNATMRPEAVFG